MDNGDAAKCHPKRRAEIPFRYDLDFRLGLCHAAAEHDCEDDEPVL